MHKQCVGGFPNSYVLPTSKATLIGGLFHCNAKHFLVKNAAEQKMALLMNGLVVKGKSQLKLYRNQCDQIGRYLKALSEKFSSKSNPNLSQLFRLR